MKLKELCEVITTYHFKVRIIESEARQLEIMGDNLPYKYDDYEVINIDTTTEIGKESSITHAIDIRPILLITIKEIA